MSVSSDKFFGKTILVVEDDITNRMLLKEILKNKGIYLHFARNGSEALSFFELNGQPDVILMDIRLPDISGIELTKNILSKFPEVVVIAQTAFATPEVEDECLMIGMKAFVSKPINAQLLERVLNRLL